MKFFNKTLDEIYDIVVSINEQIEESRDGVFELYGKLSFEFNDNWAMFKFIDLPLIDDDNHIGWEYIDALDDYEDIEICLKRLIMNRCNEISQINFK